MVNMEETIQKIKDLENAKENVRYLLEKPTALADMRGLTYWATVVENLRNEIKNKL